MSLMHSAIGIEKVVFRLVSSRRVAALDDGPQYAIYLFGGKPAGIFRIIAFANTFAIAAGT